MWMARAETPNPNPDPDSGPIPPGPSPLPSPKPPLPHPQPYPAPPARPPIPQVPGDDHRARRRIAGLVLPYQGLQKAGSEFVSSCSLSVRYEEERLRRS
jgi:hypothetical protein